MIQDRLNLTCEDVLKQIQDGVTSYFTTNPYLRSVIIGISGGLDSGINAAILKPICNSLGIKIIGRYISIETNTKEEEDRANMIGSMFCDDYKKVDLTEAYHLLLPHVEENEVISNPTYDDKIRRGNIKARLRMIHLYNLSQKYNGLVLDNDNMTEHLLGFWTLHGDVGGLTPLFSLYKTEVYELAKYISQNLHEQNKNDEANALDAVINAVPTDGLGITSSDVEQFGVPSYNEVDDILINFKAGNASILALKYENDQVSKIIKRHQNSEFKRHYPHRIEIKKG